MACIPNLFEQTMCYIFNRMAAYHLVEINFLFFSLLFCFVSRYFCIHQSLIFIANTSSL